DRAGPELGGELEQLGQRVRDQVGAEWQSELVSERGRLAGGRGAGHRGVDHPVVGVDPAAGEVVRVRGEGGFEGPDPGLERCGGARLVGGQVGIDRKSTRLNSSHVKISYAVFCLKKKT